MSKYWIMMADIQGSSELPGDTVMEVFSNVVSEANKKFIDGILSPLSITLGDEFQGVVDNMDVVREIIFFMDQELLTVKPFFTLRMVAGYGTIDTPLNKETSYGMLGEGLTAARERLNELKKSEEYIQVFGNPSQETDRIQTLAFRWYRSLYQGWPEKDRQIAADFIREVDYKKVASLHGRDASSSWRKRETLQMKDFEASKELITLLTKGK
jgi:hypothetical protein